MIIMTSITLSSQIICTLIYFFRALNLSIIKTYYAINKIRNAYDIDNAITKYDVILRDYGY